MSPTRLSKLEAAMRVVLAFNEAFNRQDIEGMLDLMSDDCIVDTASPAPDGTVYSGKEAITHYWGEFFGHSPSAHIEIEEIFGLGERCILRWRFKWEDTKGERRHTRGIDLYRVRGGIIREKLSYIKG